MGLSRIRLWLAAMVAFMLGFPMAEQAKAADGWDIADAAFGLAYAIIDVAGDS